MITLSARRLVQPTLLLIVSAVVACVAALQLLGAFRPFDDALADARARWLARAVSSDVVIVAVDEPSLDALGEWPWPRAYHAQLIAQVTRAAPRALFIDLDFSTLSNTYDDALLETALAKPRDYPLQLPVRVRPASAAEGETILKGPRPRFVRGVELVIEAHETAPDGLVRTWRNSWKRGTGWQRSVVDPLRTLPEEHDVIIDYSILPSSFTQISYADVLAGRVPLEALAGKRIFVGATVPGIADMLPVPAHGALPAVIVQALAYETVRAGAPSAPTGWKLSLLIVSWTLLVAWLYGKNGWRNLIVLTLSSCAVVALSFLAFAHYRLWIGAAAPLLAGLLMCVAATLRSLDPRVWRALAAALRIDRRNARLDGIVQDSSDPLLCVDERGVIRAANAAASRLFDSPVHELVDQPLGKFITLFAGEGAGARLFVLDERGRECDARTLSGEVFPVEISSRQVRLDTARLFAVTVRDIRDRRLQGRYLRQDEMPDQWMPPPGSRGHESGPSMRV